MTSTTQENNVTSPGGSDTQEAAADCLQASRQRSSSNNREETGAGVASQAPVNLHITSAETDAPSGPHQNPARVGDSTRIQTSMLQQKLLRASNEASREDNLPASVSKLKKLLKDQNDILNALFSEVDNITVLKGLTRSDRIKESIDKLGTLSDRLNVNRSPLHGALNTVMKSVDRAEAQRQSTAAKIPVLPDPKPPSDEDNCVWIKERLDLQDAKLEQIVTCILQSKDHKAQPDQSARSQDKQEVILKACEALAVSLAKQQEDINALKSTHTAPVPNYASKVRNHFLPQISINHTEELPPQEQETQDWTKVDRKKGKNKATKKLPSENKETTKPPPENAKKTKRPLPDSISVKPENGETYSDILKAIRQKVDINAIGSQVSSISESRNGGIIIRLTHQDKKREELVDAIKSHLGDRAAVKSLVSYDDLDLQDLDNITTVSEIESCIKSALGLPEDDTSIKVKNIRPAYAGTQRSTVRLKSADAIKLVKKGRLRIGWINARVRIKPTTTRCFRCLGYGHSTRTCKGPDRAKSCSLCLGESHRASSCTSPPNCAACRDINEATDHFPGSGKCVAYRQALSKHKPEPKTEDRDTAKTSCTLEEQKNA